ncbi:hypothetical protein [Marinobacterium jannaschii]|uniref:hypothetical protein n=1 Tax=Marinobacterium jannaschii TaxID=64970 RepID=UPI000489C2EC|nr:hypothetical protein [Marinobacterium jannaschii]
MRKATDSILQIFCGGPAIVYMFMPVYLLMELPGDSILAAYLDKPASQFGLIDLLFIILFFLIWFLYFLIVLYGNAYLWLKLSSKVIGKQRAADIFLQTYRAPKRGLFRNSSRSIVAWVLGDPYV